MRIVFTILVVVSFLTFAGYSIWERENIRDTGNIVFIKVGNVVDSRDPWGDYLNIHYNIDKEILNSIEVSESEISDPDMYRHVYYGDGYNNFILTNLRKGYFVFQVDDKKVAVFDRVYMEGEKLADNEKLLAFKISNSSLEIFPNFLSSIKYEDMGTYVDLAKYVVLGFKGHRKCIILGFADSNMDIIEPQEISTRN